MRDEARHDRIDADGARYDAECARDWPGHPDWESPVTYPTPGMVAWRVAQGERIAADRLALYARFPELRGGAP